MSDERVTIACAIGAATCGAAVVGGHRIDGADHYYQHPRYCARHVEQMTHDGWYAYLPLINPGTATADEIANVRAAIEAICRLIRALWHDDAASRDDRDSLTMACVEARVMRERLCVCTFDDDVPRADCDECGGRGVLAAVECAA